MASIITFSRLMNLLRDGVGGQQAWRKAVGERKKVKNDTERIRKKGERVS